MDGSAIRNLVRDRFPDACVSDHAAFGNDTVVVERHALHDILAFLKADPKLCFNLFVDLCGVDHLPAEPRFEVVYHLKSIKHGHRLRVKSTVPEDDALVASVTDLWPAADWYERECFDMFGIRFSGHPNLRRILTHQDFEGHPLRKDYPINRRQDLHLPVEDILTPKPFNG